MVTNTRPSGKKWSQFTKQTTVSGTASMNVEDGGKNVTISVDDFASQYQLADISSEGSGTPVLDIAGSQNKIRAIESSGGVSVAVGPTNNIQLGVDLVNGVSGGGEVLVDPSSTPIVARTIRAGTGIAVSSVDDSLVVSLSATPVTTKTVIVSSPSDFPAPSGGVITLADDTEYLLVNDVTVSDRFQLGSKNSLRSGSRTLTELTYTGTGAMFTAVDPLFKIIGMTLTCMSGSLVDFTSTTGNGAFQCVESSISCNSGGTIDSGLLTRFDAVAWLAITGDGVTYSGVGENVVYTDNIVFLLGGNFIDFGTSVYNNILVTNASLEFSAGGTAFIAGAAASANVSVGGLATVTNTRINGSATPLVGITSDDIRWQFQSNDSIPDTNPDALISLSGNATETVISSIGVPVKMAGAWVCEGESFFSCDTTGRATYNGERNLTAPIDIVVSLSSAAGTNKDIKIYVAINGVIVANSGKSNRVGATDPKNTTVLWQYEFTTNDYVEVFVENNTDTTNLIGIDAILRVR